MATRVTQTSSNRPFGNGGGGNRSDSVDVGSAAIARMAREDTQWFIIGVVVLSVVLFLALPLSMMIYFDTAKMRYEINHEIKQLRKLKQELKQELKDRNEKADSSH